MPDVGFNWDEYLTLAKRLLEYIPTEYSYRAAVSRAYYAAYWNARLTISINGGTVPDQGSHAMAWMTFDIKTDATGDGSIIGRQLKKLKEQREWAGYAELPNMRKDVADIACRRAEKIVEQLRALTPKTRGA